MDFAPILTALEPELKALVKKAVDSAIFPIIKGFEDKIPAGTFKELVDALTLPVEAEIDALLS